MRGFGLSVDPQPCRCLFHITPAIPNNHFTPSSLHFSITNTQYAPFNGCFQPPLSPNSQKIPHLGSNNGSDEVAKQDLAALDQASGGKM